MSQYFLLELQVLFSCPKIQWNFVRDVSDTIRFWEAILVQHIYNGLKISS